MNGSIDFKKTLLVLSKLQNSLVISVG